MFPSRREIAKLDCSVISYINTPEHKAVRIVMVMPSPFESEIHCDGYMASDVVMFSSSESGHSGEMMVPMSRPTTGDLLQDEKAAEWSPSDIPSPCERVQVARLDALSSLPVRVIDTGCLWQTMMWSPDDPDTTFSDFVHSSLKELGIRARPNKKSKSKSNP